MKLQILGVAALGFLLVAGLPIAAATSAVTGTATACTSTVACTFALKSGTSTGWATTTYNTISFQLPGESNATKGVQYTVHSSQVTGSIYHMLGSFAVIDVNTHKIVYGSTDTNITVTVHCTRGCSTTYTLDNGTIAFHPTSSDGTSTTVSCNPGSFQDGNFTKCTAKVKDLSFATKVPTGNVSWSTSTSYFGTFSKKTCTLVSGSCTVRFTPGDGQIGTMPIYASFLGVAAYYKSSGSTLIYVTSNGG